MLEAFYLGLYLLILSPILIYMGWDNPYWIFFVLLALSMPGLYAMVKGAPFLPTTRKTTKKMIELAEIEKNHEVYDLGCGDGRLVFGAAKKGAKATGYELSIPVYIWAKVKSWFKPNSKIEYRDFWGQDYKGADVIFCFLLVQSMERFEREVWPGLKSGCRVVSHAFRMPNIKPTHDLEGVRVYVKP